MRYDEPSELPARWNPEGQAVDIDMNDPAPGRIDYYRLAHPILDGSDPYPVVTAEDRAETLRLIALEREGKIARAA